MLHLTEYEIRMRDGEFGEFKQAALQKIITYAEALGATELCEVSKATLYLGAQTYLETLKSDDYDEIFSKMYLCSDKTIPLDNFHEDCFCQTCVAPCDQYEWQPLHLSKELFDKNNRFLALTKEAGVSIVGSCTPYFVGWIPLRGEHFVTTESSNVVVCNSLFGACGNSDGIEAAAWSAICGRTPKWGYHVAENRLGTTVFEIECAADTPTDWDIIGYTVGRMLSPLEVPILVGEFKRPDIIRLKQCFAAMATTSGVAMCHIVGLTPEAPTLEAALGNKKPAAEKHITQEDYDISRQLLCASGTGAINYVMLGCPHYCLQEIRDAALYLRNRKIKEGVEFLLWTDYATKEMANQNGYTAYVEAAGGHIMTSGCPLIIGKKCVAHVTAMATDGAKQAHYIRSEIDVPVYYGDMYQCIDAAVSGIWKSEQSGH